MREECEARRKIGEAAAANEGRRRRRRKRSNGKEKRKTEDGCYSFQFTNQRIGLATPIEPISTHWTNQHISAPGLMETSVYLFCMCCVSVRAMRICVCMCRGVCCPFAWGNPCFLLLNTVFVLMLCFCVWVQSDVTCGILLVGNTVCIIKQENTLPIMSLLINSTLIIKDNPYHVVFCVSVSWMHTMWGPCLRKWYY